MNSLHFHPIKGTPASSVLHWSHWLHMNVTEINIPEGNLLFDVGYTTEVTPCQLLICKLDFVRTNYFHFRDLYCHYKVFFFFCTHVEGMLVSRGIAPLILNLCTRCSTVVNHMPSHIIPMERVPGTYWTGCWVGPSASLDILWWWGGFVTPTGILILDHPACSNSLKVSSQSAGQQIPHVLWDVHIHEVMIRTA